MDNINTIKKLVNTKFSNFGVNRRQQLSRLLFEISKREELTVAEVIKEGFEEKLTFDQIKSKLVDRRYPSIKKLRSKPEINLPDVSINESHKLTIKHRVINLKNVYIERSVENTELVQRIKRLFPNANYELIKTYKDHVGRQRASVEQYNDRLNHFYVIKEEFDFLKKCPCSNNSLFCGYHIINLGSGCAFECNYCYLQDYINSKGIVLPANLEDFFETFTQYNKNVRIGSGELTDSLIFDHITGYSKRIVEFFKKHPKAYFEFKTKSNNVGELLKVKPAGNIIVSWTLNPQKVIDECEHYTASLEERLEAARQCALAGYKIIFHFDPIVYFKGYEKEYSGLINQVFNSVPNDALYCLSVGTLRMTPRLKQIIENRFPENKILDEEFFVGHDGKLRYSQELRNDIYTNMSKWIKAKNTKIPIYLCMEEKEMCLSTQLGPLKGIKR